MAAGKRRNGDPFAHPDERMKGPKGGSPKPRRRARNLSLSDEAVERGTEYARARGASLSEVVDGLLRALPAVADPHDEQLTPIVRRLRELLAAPHDQPRDWRAEHGDYQYRKHLGGEEG